MTQTWTPTLDFASRLRVLRYNLHQTVEETARQCGVPDATWSSWENGTKPRDLANVVARISEATGVAREWLMWDTPQPRQLGLFTNVSELPCEYARAI